MLSGKHTNDNWSNVCWEDACTEAPRGDAGISCVLRAGKSVKESGVFL